MATPDPYWLDENGRRLPKKACPKCGASFLLEKTTKKHGRQILCNNDDCDYARSEELPDTAA